MTNLRKTIPSPTYSTTKRDFSIAHFKRIVLGKNFRNLLKFYIPFLILLLVAGLQQTVPVEILTRDIFVTTQAPVYTGLLSNLGILTWGISCAICIFTWFLVKPNNSQEKKVKAFIGWSGLISVFMMIDDFFMLHEEVIPTHVGIPEKLIVLAELAWVVFHLYYFRKIILNSTPYKILGLSLLWFIFSLGVDVLPIEINYHTFQSNLMFILEDGSKLMGIVTWCFYFCTVCYQQIIRFQKNAYLQSNFSSFQNDN